MKKNYFITYIYYGWKYFKFSFFHNIITFLIFNPESFSIQNIIGKIFEKKSTIFNYDFGGNTSTWKKALSKNARDWIESEGIAD